MSKYRMLIIEQAILPHDDVYGHICCVHVGNKILRSVNLKYAWEQADIQIKLWPKKAVRIRGIRTGGEDILDMPTLKALADIAKHKEEM